MIHCHCHSKLSPNATSAENGYFPVRCDADDELDAAAAELAAVELTTAGPAAEVLAAGEPSAVDGRALLAAAEESTGSSTFISPPLAGEIGTRETVVGKLGTAASLLESATTDDIDVEETRRVTEPVESL